MQDATAFLQNSALSYWAYQMYDLARLASHLKGAGGRPGYVHGVLKGSSKLTTIVPESAWCRKRVDWYLHMELFRKHGQRYKAPPFERADARY